MNFINIKQPRLFLQKTQAALERDESANALMLGVSQQLAEEDYHDQKQPFPTMVCVEDEQGLTSAGLMTPPYCLIVYSEPTQMTDSIHCLTEGLSDQQLPGVIGKKQVVEAFSTLWCTQHRLTPHVHRSGRVYQLNRVIHTASAPGKMRLADESDFDLVLEWAKTFDVEALDGEEGSAVIEHTRQHIQKNETYLWQDGVATAMAVNNRKTRHGASIGYVYCPPALRGRGYATALVSALSQLLLDQGATFCTLMTDLANPVSNHIYQKMGYVPVCDIEEVHFHL